MCVLYDQRTYVDKEAYVVYRDKNKTNIAKFHDKLRNIVWSDLPKYNNPKHAYGSFLNKFNETFNYCFPLKKVNAFKYGFRKPWLSKGLWKSIKRKNKLFKKSVINENVHKKFRNKLNHLLRIAKRKYYEGKLENAKSNTKNTWKILNEVLNKKRRPRNYPPNLQLTIKIFLIQ